LMYISYWTASSNVCAGSIPFRLNMMKPVGEILAYTRHDYGYPLA